MNIFQINQILLEYNKSGKLTTISGEGGEKAAGKNFDNIVAGITQPYKQQVKNPSQTERTYPYLAKSVQQLKNDAISGNKILIGGSLNDVKKLMQNKNLRKDQNGQIILPFGDNVRLIKNGNNFFIKLSEKQ